MTGYVEGNRAAWDRRSAEYAAYGRRAWAREEPVWGIWHLPERELRALPEVAGRDVVELGCGTAYWSAWLARRGARVVALDVSDGQLATARIQRPVTGQQRWRSSNHRRSGHSKRAASGIAKHSPSRPTFPPIGDGRTKLAAVTAR